MGSQVVASDLSKKILIYQKLKLEVKIKFQVKRKVQLILYNREPNSTMSFLNFSSTDLENTYNGLTQVLQRPNTDFTTALQRTDPNGQ